VPTNRHPAIVADGPDRLRKALAARRAASHSESESERPDAAPVTGPKRRIRRLIAAIWSAHEPLASSRPDHRCFHAEE